MRYQPFRFWILASSTYELAPELSSLQTKKPLGDTPAEQAILKLLQNGVRDGDKLLSKSNLEASEFNQVITLLEIKGHIRSLGANQWSLR